MMCGLPCYEYDCVVTEDGVLGALLCLRMVCELPCCQCVVTGDSVWVALL